MSQFSLGIEEEYLLVDPETRDLVASPDPAFMATCNDLTGGRVRNELLQAQVEIGTPARPSVATAARELRRLRAEVIAAAEAHGMAVMASSTHPFAQWRALKRSSKQRYDQLARDYRIIADRMAICGMHVHVGIEDADERIDLMNQATYFLPHLLTLSTSSPFWQGEHSGLMAYRPTVFRDLPRTGLPEHLENDQQWQDLLRTLSETGLCDDGSKIWWDLRPSIKHPTLEVRVCDICTRVEDTIAITALYQALIATLHRLRHSNQSWRYYRHLLIEENKWRAQRYGVAGDLADFGCRSLKPFKDLMEELIVLVREAALELGCLAELLRIREIVADGTSADHQLRVHRASLDAGADQQEALVAVVDWLIQTTREGTAIDQPTDRSGSVAKRAATS